jgi:hypothetical protein
MLYPKEFILPTTNDPVSLLFYLFIGCTNDNLDTNYVRELAIVTPKEEHNFILDIKISSKKNGDLSKH